jgi:hypothetical protein
MFTTGAIVDAVVHFTGSAWVRPTNSGPRKLTERWRGFCAV